MKSRSIHRELADAEYWRNYRLCPYKAGAVVACFLSAAIVIMTFVVVGRWF